jgi:hypothetical protein
MKCTEIKRMNSNRQSEGHRGRHFKKMTLLEESTLLWATHLSLPVQMGVQNTGEAPVDESIRFHIYDKQSGIPRFKH